MHVMVVLQIIQTVFLQKFLMPFKEAIGSAGISDVKKKVRPLQKTCWASMSLWPLYCCAALYLPVMERDFRLSLRSSIDPR